MPRPPAPRAGDIIALPLANGRFALVWMITCDENGSSFLVLEDVLASLPSAPEALAMRPARPPNPHLLPGYDDVWKGWFDGDLPADFRVVGNRLVTSRERRWIENYSGTMIFGTAERLRTELLKSWRWEHERAAMEAETAAAQAAGEARAAKRRASLTLEKMARERIFAGWAHHRPASVVREARRIFRDATNELIALERDGTARERAHVLERITTEFNALYDATGCIESVERDQIIARVEELAARVGLENGDEKLTGHRDW